ncbi:MAG TPA: hypothetical protein VL285_04755 [Bryobacteraceae bacterium]|nr:hypothetical protein [Bryobacteraceae bacterium]
MKQFLLLTLMGAAALQGATFYVTVAGLGGEPDYEQRFSGWAKDIDKVLKTAPDAKVHTLFGADATKAALKTVFDRIGKEAKSQDALVVMLIGHGAFDGFDYKINLPGPDMSAIELATILDRMPPARQLVVNMTSSSGGAIEALRKENRVVVSATKTGTEKNATVFARYWAEALRDPAADSDKNETVSALEAFRYADQKTAKFYETQKRIATEHALLEDTGKGAGVRSPAPDNGEGMLASAFPLLRLGANASAARNPQKLKLLAQKEELEQQIDRLKYQKAAMPIEDYKRQLGALLLQLAKTQAELDQ